MIPENLFFFLSDVTVIYRACVLVMLLNLSTVGGQLFKTNNIAAYVIRSPPPSCKVLHRTRSRRAGC